jgi:protein-L-isoaspartate(D-aspartate) O-methyltransferase
MCELLELTGHETLLDVGTGSGYHAAVLARLARRVVSIERHRALSDMAAASLRVAGADNVELVVGDGTLGHPPDAPYDAINVGAAGRGVPAALEDQLGPGGRIVIPSDDERRLLRLRRLDGNLVEERLDPVRFVPLIGAGAARRRGRGGPAT